MPDNPIEQNHTSRSRFAPENFSAQTIKLQEAQTIISGRCLISRNALQADKHLMLHGAANEAEGQQMEARWRSLITIPPQNGEFAFRGMQVTEAGLLDLLNQGMKNTRKFHMMLTFGHEAGLAVPYSFKPVRSDIAADESALSIVSQINISRLQSAGICIEKEPTVGVLYDVWDDIPAKLLDRVFIYDYIDKEFLLLSESSEL